MEKKIIQRQELVEKVSEHVNQILRRNLYELKLDEKQMTRLERQKEELRRNLKAAGTGNRNVKEYLITFIEEFLLNSLLMDEEKINETFLFSREGLARWDTMFDILLFLYEKEYQMEALEHLICGTEDPNILTLAPGEPITTSLFEL